MALPKRKANELAIELGAMSFNVPDFRVRGLMKEARDLLSKTTPSDAAVLYMAIGHAHARLNEHEKALEMHTKAARLDSKNSIHQNNIGVATLELGDIGKALDAYLLAIDLIDDPTDPIQIRSKAIAMGNIAEAFALLGDPDTASEAMREAISLALSQDEVNTMWIAARQASLVEEDDAAIELVARSFAMMQGIARGTEPAWRIIEKTPESIREKFAYSSELVNVLERGEHFGAAIAHLPRIARGPQRPGSTEAAEVFEDLRDARERATAEVLHDPHDGAFER